MGNAAAAQTALPLQRNGVTAYLFKAADIARFVSRT